MHVHTFRTKYTFGDRVRFASKWNGSGTGKIISITFHDDAEYDYLIDIDGSREIAGGIMDAEIMPLTESACSPEGATGNSQG